MAHLRLVPSYLGDNLPQTLLEQMASKWPSPSNAQALAALTAFTEPADNLAAIASGEPESVAMAYYTPTGILPRMRLLAAGFTRKGDKFKSATDRAWWTARYAHPLWPVLRAWLRNARNPSGGPTHLSDDVANADAGALSQELLAINDELRAIGESGLLGMSPPYLIPKGETMPAANASFPVGVITKCTDKRTGKWCSPVLIDENGRLSKNPNCECKQTAIDPIREVGERTSNVVLLLLLLVLLAKGK